MTRLEPLFPLLLIAWALFYSNITIAETTSSHPPVTNNTDREREEQTYNRETSKDNKATPSKESTAPVAIQNADRSDRKEETDRQKTYTQQEWIWPPPPDTWLTLLVATVSAIATFAYTVISWGQWRVLRNQNRPWIMVTPDPPQGWPSDVAGPCTFYLKWRAENVGKSPAFLTQLCVKVVVFPYPVKDKCPDYGKTGRFAELIIRPNGYHGHGDEHVLSEPEVIATQTGEKCLLFYGFVDYRDTFKRYHRTRFCSYWRQEGEKITFFPVGPPSYIKYT